MSDIDS